MRCKEPQGAACKGLSLFRSSRSELTFPPSKVQSRSRLSALHNVSTMAPYSRNQCCTGGLDDISPALKFLLPRPHFAISRSRPQTLLTRAALRRLDSKIDSSPARKELIKVESVIYNSEDSRSRTPGTARYRTISRNLATTLVSESYSLPRPLRLNEPPLGV